MKIRVVSLLCMVCIIAACLPLKHEKKVTIKSLGGREFVLKPDAGIESSGKQAIARYQEFLDSAPDTPMRIEAQDFVLFDFAVFRLKFGRKGNDSLKHCQCLPGLF